MKSERISNNEIILISNQHVKGAETGVRQSVQLKSNSKWKLLDGKKSCIVLSVVSSLAIWTILLVPLIVLIVKVGTNLELASTNNTIFNLLPPINVTSNYSNFTIERVECVDNFVYVPGDEICYPECDWNPSGDDSVKIVGLFLGILSVFSIVLCTATLIAWLLLSCIDWKKFRFHYDFQLPRTSLFMVVMSSLFLVVINASIDLMQRDFFFCQFTKDGQSYLLPHMFNSVSNVLDIKIITNVIGALNNYSFLVTIGWILLSLLNIMVVVFFPQLRNSFRKRIFIFLVQCFCCFGLNIIPIVIAISVNPESPYVVNILASFIGISNPLVFFLFFAFPHFLTPSLVISLIIIIITKLRLVSLRSKEMTGQAIKLTDLEKRLIIYSFGLMVLLLVHGIDIILLAFLTPGYFESVTKFILCMTVNSPILTLPSNFTGSNATLNNTVPVYRENPYGDVDACRMLESEADRYLPHSIILSLTIYLRLIWIPVFFVLIPLITPKILRNWIRTLRTK